MSQSSIFSQWFDQTCTCGPAIALSNWPEGIVAAYEMLVITPAISNLIRENKTYRIDSSIQTGKKEGMFLMDDSLYRLWKKGVCEKEDVLAKSQRQQDLAFRILQVERGEVDDEDDEFEDDYEDEDDEDEDDEGEDDRPRRPGPPGPPSTGIQRRRSREDDED